MRRTIASATAAGLVLSLSCGGESERRERTHSGDDAGESGTGSGGKGAAGAAGCATCGGGKAGQSGTPGFAGFSDVGFVGGAAGSSAGAAGLEFGGRVGAGAGGASGSGGRATAGRGGVSGAGGGDAGRAGSSVLGGEGGMPAALDGLSISKVAIYQGVEITLMRDGEDLTPNAPIVVGRDAMLRIWLTPGPEFEARSVAVTLTLSNGAGPLVPVEMLVNGPPRDYDLASTLNLSLAGSELSEATALVISVHDVATDEELARWPELTGTKALAAESANDAFVVVLVPFTVGGFTPDLAATRDRFATYLRQMSPVPDVAVTIREMPVVLPFDVIPNGGGWDEALDTLYDTRDADDPDSNVYYYGVLTPGATFDDYCYEDCVVGLASVASRSEEQYRGAIGTGYFENMKDTFSQETMVHELGHALGRDHAPCGSPDGVDRRYPYEYAAIGVYGYHDGKLVDPDDTRDVMSYCTPVWISDYTYAAMFERLAYVNGSAKRRVTRGERARQRTLAVRADGTLRWGNERSPASPPAGEPTPVELLDAAGAVLDVAMAPFARLDHLPGGFLSVPSEVLSRPGVESVRVGGEVLRVP